ncbi:ribonuclease H-like domain-containing protein [Tanacetum coccineum]|uniref:Ribonuclease H-like domain-containing protein n=1 Tax=Tanacetum coccineum TaxID=301880 RepID=A0ABQ5JC82_9ASTR
MNECPLAEPLILSVEDRVGPNKDDVLGRCMLSLQYVDRSLALSRNWPIHRLDVKNAFLNGDLSETVYMYQPLGVVDARVSTSCLSLIEVSIWLETSTTCLVSAISKLCSTGMSTYALSSRACAALKRVLRYVYSTLDFGLQLYASCTSSLVAYTDADWASCPFNRRSTSGCCVLFRDNILSCSSKWKHTLSRSSVETEYRGVANVVTKTACLRNLLCELYTRLLYDTLVYYDNVSAIYFTFNLVQHQQTKYIEIDIHLVRDMVARGQSAIGSLFVCIILVLELLVALNRIVGNLAKVPTLMRKNPDQIIKTRGILRSQLREDEFENWNTSWRRLDWMIFATLIAKKKKVTDLTKT